MKRPLHISVVTPCFNEEYYIDDVYRAVREVFERELPEVTWELIYVENGSTDGSYEKIRALAESDPRVKIVKLSRNFRYEGGICAGLAFASGDAVVVIDCDLQDPVELIPEFVRLYRQGYEVVYGIKRSRKEGFWKRLGYRLFYKIFSRMSEYDFPQEAGEFCLMDRKVYRLIATMKEQRKFLRALRFWTGFRQIGIHYDRRGREKGETKHPFRAMVSLALDGLLSFSGLPLRLISLLGIAVTIFSIFGAIYAILWKFLSGKEIPGYASLWTTMFFFGCVQMLSLGVIGEYLYRVYNEVRQRPHFIVDRLVNIEAKPNVPLPEETITNETQTS